MRPGLIRLWTSSDAFERLGHHSSRIPFGISDEQYSSFVAYFWGSEVDRMTNTQELELYFTTLPTLGHEPPYTLHTCFLMYDSFLRARTADTMGYMDGRLLIFMGYPFQTVEGMQVDYSHGYCTTQRWHTPFTLFLAFTEPTTHVVFAVIWTWISSFFDDFFSRTWACIHLASFEFG